MEWISEWILIICVKMAGPALQIRLGFKDIQQVYAAYCLFKLHLIVFKCNSLEGPQLSVWVIHIDGSLLDYRFIDNTIQVLLRVIIDIDIKITHKNLFYRNRPID